MIYTKDKIHFSDYQLYLKKNKKKGPDVETSARSINQNNQKILGIRQAGYQLLIRQATISHSIGCRGNRRIESASVQYIGRV